VGSNKCYRERLIKMLCETANIRDFVLDILAVVIAKSGYQLVGGGDSGIDTCPFSERFSSCVANGNFSSPARASCSAGSPGTVQPA